MDFSTIEENMLSSMQVVCHKKPTCNDNFFKLKSLSEKINLSVFLGVVQCWQRRKRGELSV